MAAGGGQIVRIAGNSQTVANFNRHLRTLTFNELAAARCGTLLPVLCAVRNSFELVELAPGVTLDQLSATVTAKYGIALNRPRKRRHCLQRRARLGRKRMLGHRRRLKGLPISYLPPEPDRYCGNMRA